MHHYASLKGGDVYILGNNPISKESTDEYINIK